MITPAKLMRRPGGSVAQYLNVKVQDLMRCLAGPEGPRPKLGPIMDLENKDPFRNHSPIVNLED